MLHFSQRQQIRRRPGDVFLAGPGVPHYSCDHRYPLEWITAYFEPSVLLEMGAHEDAGRILQCVTVVDDPSRIHSARRAAADLGSRSGGNGRRMQSTDVRQRIAAAGFAGRDAGEHRPQRAQPRRRVAPSAAGRQLGAGRTRTAYLQRALSRNNLRATTSRQRLASAHPAYAVCFAIAWACLGSTTCRSTAFIRPRRY